MPWFNLRYLGLLRVGGVGVEGLQIDSQHNLQVRQRQPDIYDIRHALRPLLLTCSGDMSSGASCHSDQLRSESHLVVPAPKGLARFTGPSLDAAVVSPAWNPKQGNPTWQPGYPNHKNWSPLEYDSPSAEVIGWSALQALTSKPSKDLGSCSLEHRPAAQLNFTPCHGKRRLVLAAQCGGSGPG